MSDDTERAIGALQAEVGNLKFQVSALNTKVDELLEVIHQAKGGWKTIMLVAGVAGSAGAVIGKFASFIKLG
jgi:hypothetical protein